MGQQDRFGHKKETQRDQQMPKRVKKGVNTGKFHDRWGGGGWGRYVVFMVSLVS